MTEVEVARLRLSCGPDQAGRARFAIEDGLRTTIPDERRLILLRKMQIAAGASSGNPARRQEAVRSGWLAAVAGGRHGGGDGADGANCVWFESREEAERLLLARLLAGRAVDGWYWKLAVPMWRGQPVRAFLSESVAHALAAGDDRRVLAVARACIEAGASDRLAEALAVSLPPVPARPAAPAVPAEARFADPPRSDSSGGEAGTIPAPPLPMPLPAGLRGAVAGLVRAGGDGPAAARAILRAWAVRQSPALALSPPLLASAVAAALDEIRSPGGAGPPPPGPSSSPSPRPRLGGTDSVPERRTAALRRGQALRRTEECPFPARARAQAASVPSAPAGDPPEREEARPAGRHSRHAGLWLVLPSLVRLGFREWLVERPFLLATDPGSRLIHAIARHHRVDPDDSALAVLPPAPGTEPEEWIGWWRHGLDRWLRRTARRRLHDLVNRPGELDWDEWRLDIVYPAADADIALRRLALDRDPGWTDWLGLSVRFHFGGPEVRL